MFNNQTKNNKGFTPTPFVKKGVGSRSERGFTLIELLVVVSIISLLSSVVFASLNSARAKGRNAARLQAVQTLRNAFNLSRTSTGSFPITQAPLATEVGVCITATCYDSWASFYTSPPAVADSINTFLAPSLPQKPVDPPGGSRNFGGFLYISPSAYTSGGSTIIYVLELASSCGPGVSLNTQPTYTICVLNLDS